MNAALVPEELLISTVANMLDCLGHFDEDSDGPRAA